MSSPVAATSDAAVPAAGQVELITPSGPALITTTATQLSVGVLAVLPRINPLPLGAVAVALP
jgi:hypothetical protein